MSDSDEKTKLLNANEKTAGSLRLNALSYWTFWWVVKTIRAGYNSPLDSKDVYDILPTFSAKENAERLQANRCTKSGISGTETTFRVLQAFPTETAYLMLVSLLTECVRLSQPYALGLFLDFIRLDTIPARLGYLYAGLLVLSAAAYFPLNVHSYYMAELFGMRVRAAYTSVIYNKILQLNSSQHQKITSGNIVNLLSTDLECINKAFAVGFSGVASAFNMVVVVLLLFLQVGLSCLTGLCIAGTLFLVSVLCSRTYAQMRSKIADASDRRVQLMSEIISAIRVIKMYCWETSFQDYISKAREKEMRHIVRGNVLKAVSDGCSSAPGAAITAAVLITYYLAGHQLDTTIVFRTMLYCQMLQIVALGGVARTVQYTGQAFRSFQRIEDFLRQNIAHEKVDTNEQNDALFETSNTAVRLIGVTASWKESYNNDEHLCQLKDITLTCEQGSLTAVVGPVGAGKTSLLMHIAGEMPSETGQLIKRGQISYCPQNAWIFQDTVQQNILFGQNMEIARYKQVIEICGLRKAG